MKIESEKKIERNLKLEVEALGGLCIKLPAVYLIGIPDRLCLLQGGVIFFAEIKTTAQKVRKSQLLMHKKLDRLGFKVYVLDSSESLENIQELC